MRNAITLVVLCWFLVTPIANAWAEKCTGSPNCTACRNCSRCAHCRAGGTCGACAPHEAKDTPSPRRAPASPKSQAEATAKQIGPQVPDGLVVRVVDGDTIVVQYGGKPEKIRLIGVDTPEEVDPRKPVQYYAREAAKFTEKLTLNQKVRLEVQVAPMKRDRYGRVLAYVFRQSDELLINKEIIRQGFGFAYLKYPFDAKRMMDFRAAEQEARANKRGLWAPVVDKYRDMTEPKHEPRAESWLKIGDALAKAKPEAAKSWYAKIVNVYPRSIQCSIAIERLNLPPAAKVDYPPLDSELALSLLGGVQIPTSVTLSDQTGRSVRSTTP